MSDLPDPPSITEQFHLLWNAVLTIGGAALMWFGKRTFAQIDDKLSKIDQKADKSDMENLIELIEQVRTENQTERAAIRAENADRHNANLGLMSSILAAVRNGGASN